MEEAPVKRREERDSASSSGERVADRAGNKGAVPRECIFASAELGEMSFVGVNRQKVWSTDCTFLPKMQQQSAF